VAGDSVAAATSSSAPSLSSVVSDKPKPNDGPFSGNMLWRLKSGPNQYFGKHVWDCKDIQPAVAGSEDFGDPQLTIIGGHFDTTPPATIWRWVTFSTRVLVPQGNIECITPVLYLNTGTFVSSTRWLVRVTSLRPTGFEQLYINPDMETFSTQLAQLADKVRKLESKTLSEDSKEEAKQPLPAATPRADRRLPVLRKISHPSSDEDEPEMPTAHKPMAQSVNFWEERAKAAVAKAKLQAARWVKVSPPGTAPKS